MIRGVLNGGRACGDALDPELRCLHFEVDFPPGRHVVCGGVEFRVLGKRRNQERVVVILASKNVGEVPFFLYAKVGMLGDSLHRLVVETVVENEQSAGISGGAY